MLRILQHQFALNAQQLRDVPLFLLGFAAPQGPVDRRKPFFDLTCFAEASREFPQRKEKARQEPGVARAIYFTPQERQSRLDVAAFGHDHALETARPKPPKAYRVTLSVLEQHVAVALRRIEITGQKSDWARALAQHAAEGQGVTVRAPFLDVVLDKTPRLIEETLQPQDAGTEIVRRDPQIERENLGLLDQEIEGRAHLVDVTTCAILVAEKVQRHGKKATGQHQVGRIARALRCLGETLSELECFEKFAIVELVDTQTPEGAQAGVLVIEPARQFEGGCEGRARSPRTTLSIR